MKEKNLTKNKLLFLLSFIVLGGVLFLSQYPREPELYIASITHNGDLSSQSVSTLVAEMDQNTSKVTRGLSPEAEYIKVAFKAPGEIVAEENEPKWIESQNTMWIGCRPGYTTYTATSTTGGRIDDFFLGREGYRVGMEIFDNHENVMVIACKKS